jgi:hypothetical protein
MRPYINYCNWINKIKQCVSKILLFLWKTNPLHTCFVMYAKYAFNAYYAGVRRMPIAESDSFLWIALPTSTYIQIRYSHYLY